MELLAEETYFMAGITSSTGLNHKLWLVLGQHISKYYVFASCTFTNGQQLNEPCCCAFKGKLCYIREGNQAQLEREAVERFIEVAKSTGDHPPHLLMILSLLPEHGHRDLDECLRANKEVSDMLIQS